MSLNIYSSEVAIAENSGNRRQKLVILGHSGFLGRCFYENFLKDLKYEVCGFSSAQIDLSSPEECLKLLNILDENTVLIMTATTLVKNKNFDSFRKDITMALNIADILLKTKIRHLIYVSSIAVYGRCSNSPINEDSQVRPDDFYSLAKSLGESVMNRVCEDRGIALTILRPGTFYGRGDVRSPIFRFLNALVKGRNIEIYGGSSSKIFWVHKMDLFQVVKSAIDNLKFGAYNIVADGRGISLITMADLISQISVRKAEIKFQPNSKIPINLEFDTSKFRSDFPEIKFIKLKHGIKEYLT